MASISVALVAICLPLTVLATISQDFQDFIKKEYGESALKQLARLDLGEQGSFGGGAHKAGEKTSKTPVIFVHGVTHYAGKLSAHRQYFLQHGYKEEEVYAPTFGGAGKVIMIYETMTCDKVKTVRAFIEAVWAYTNSTVDVVAYSQGVPISRKAILGGKCVDTGEDIGPPMTSLVRTYVGVAGPNNGCKVCYMTFGSCNTQNGLHCTSKFLADINSKQGYEGSKIYVMLSRQDDIVGYEVCGKVSPMIAGASATYEKNGVNHLALCMESFDMQYNILNTGKP